MMIGRDSVLLKGEWNMQRLREGKRLIMWAVIGGIVVFIALAALGPSFFGTDLRYERGSYSVMKDHTIASCAVKNHGRRSAKKALMSVVFLSRILGIEVSPESAERAVRIASDQQSAMIELKNIDPGDEITVSFSIEKPQDKPFDVHLMDISDDPTALKERAIP